MTENQELEILAEEAGLPSVPSGPLTLSLTEAKGLAQVFMKSGLFSDTADLAKATVKILAGYELGIGPFAAMRGINIIQGQLAPNAAVTGALIKKTPGGDYRVTKSDTKSCTIAFIQDGEEIGTITWSMEDAELAGLANKQNWKKWPRQMLFSRALTEGARQNFPHIFMGSVYVPDELGDTWEGDDVKNSVTRDARAGNAMINWPLDEIVKHAKALAVNQDSKDPDMANTYWTLGRALEVDEQALGAVVQDATEDGKIHWPTALEAVIGMVGE